MADLKDQQKLQHSNAQVREFGGGSGGYLDHVQLPPPKMTPLTIQQLPKVLSHSGFFNYMRHWMRVFLLTVWQPKFEELNCGSSWTVSHL